MIVLKNNSVCEGETEVYRGITVVLGCFSTSEDHYLFKKCFLRSALILGFLCSAGLKFENVFLKLFQSIRYAVWYI